MGSSNIKKNPATLILAVGITLGAAGGGILGAVLTWSIMPITTTHPAPHAAAELGYRSHLPAEPTTLNADAVARLSARVDALEKLIDAGGAVNARAMPAAMDEPATPRPSALAQVQNAWAAEPVDPEWVASDPYWFHAVFSQPELATTALVEADCRASLCRLEVVHSEEAEPAAFHSALAFSVADDFSNLVSYVVSDAAGTRTFVFLSK